MKTDWKKKRKHWLYYPSNETSYGSHKYGFGVYLLSGKDYWLDWESATDSEKKIYRAYLKSKGYKENEGTL
jgi:hypothetical protein